MFNVGTVDRVLRFLIGAALLSLVFVPQASGWFEAWGAWKHGVAAVGLILLATGIFGICPLYSLLGIRTNRREAM